MNKYILLLVTMLFLSSFSFGAINFGGDGAGFSCATCENTFLKLDQTSSQTIHSGTPSFEEGLNILNKSIITLDGVHYIRSVDNLNSSGIMFQSINPLPEGGFPFIYISTNGDGEIVINGWHQIGKNNSYSGQMNSFGTISSNYVNFGVSPPTNDEEGMAFLINKSSYLTYCDWLQDNLSLVPEGCKYFADTTGRGVPLGFFGDLEVHRSATIHEGILVFDNFDFITREGDDFNLLFNGYNGGKLHIRETDLVQGNFSIFTLTIADFDDSTLGFFEEVSPPTSNVNRIWRSVSEPECWSDRCGSARGGELKTMEFSSATTFVGGTVNVSEINLSFYLTTQNLDAGERFYVEVDDNQGNVQQVYNQSSNQDDVFVEITFPDIFENKANVTTKFIHNANRQVERSWVDEVKVVALPLEPVVTNESYYAGQITLGQDTDPNTECYIRMEKQYNTTTNAVQDVMVIKCPNIDMQGNLTQTEVTVENQTIIGDQSITGNLNVVGVITQNGTTLNSTYLQLDQTTPQAVTGGSPIFKGGVKIGDGVTSNHYLDFQTNNNGINGMRYFLADGTTERGYVKWNVNENLLIKGDEVRISSQNEDNAIYIEADGYATFAGNLEVYKNGVDAILKIHEDAGTANAYTHLRRGAFDWKTGMSNSGEDYVFLAEGAEKVRIDTTGKMVIGASSADNSLSVKKTGSGHSIDLDRTDGKFMKMSVTNSEDNLLIDSTGTFNIAHQARADIAGTGNLVDRFTILSTGYIGMGTSVLDENVEIADTTDPTLLLKSTTNYAGTQGAGDNVTFGTLQFGFSNGNAVQTYGYLPHISARFDASDASYGRKAGLDFYVSNPSDQSLLAMSMDKDGGTTLPDLAGTGNAYACVDSTGKLYRSATACA